MTSKFKNILLVLSEKHDDKSAIECAFEWAKISNASVKIIKVVDSLSKLIELSNIILGPTVDVRQLLTQDLKEKVKLVLNDDEPVPRVIYKILEGTAFIEIIREVIRYKHDLLITSAESEKSIDTNFFSGISFHLLRKCPCPVWVVKPTNENQFKNILVAVDIDPEDEVKMQLNNKLMNIAIMMAKQYKSEIRLFYAWQLYGEDTLSSSPFFKVDQILMDEKLKEEEFNNQRKLNTFLDAFDTELIVIHKHLHKSEPVNIIPKFIKENAVDLLVMGTVCRIGIPGFFIGNTAEEILRKVQCSVMTVKPDGFLSPVQ